jgi:hypothetical protein
MVVNQMASEGRYELAAQALAPLAYSPHPGEQTQKARQLLADLEVKAKHDERSSSAEH